MKRRRTTQEDGDSLWGVAAIAEYAELPIRRARYLIDIQALPVTRLGARIIVGSKRAIDGALGRAPGRGTVDG